jgi:hypothetical protein
MLRTLETMAMAAEVGPTRCSLPRIAMTGFTRGLPIEWTVFAIVAAPATRHIWATNSLPSAPELGEPLSVGHPLLVTG